MKAIMTYEEYLRDVKKGIVTDLGNCAVTRCSRCFKENGKRRFCMSCAFTIRCVLEF